MSKTLDKKYQKDFGKNLRIFRLAKKISQHQLALDAGLDKNVVGNIERGESNPQITTLKSIAKVLQIHPKDLLDF